MVKFSPGGALCGTAKFRAPTTIIIIFKLVTKPNMVEFVILGPKFAKMALIWVARRKVVRQKRPLETVGVSEKFNVVQVNL